MGWIALVLTLLLEQLRPLPLRNPVYAIAGTLADATHDGMNAAAVATACMRGCCWSVAPSLPRVRRMRSRLAFRGGWRCC